MANRLCDGRARGRPVGPGPATARHCLSRFGTTALASAPVTLKNGRGIGVLAVDSEGARLVYAKKHLGSAEVEHFVAGTGPSAITVDGWQVGIGVCKDTRIRNHPQANVALGIDLYVAGLVHTAAELHELDDRARRIA